MSTYRTKFHRDGSATVWNVFTQRWERTRHPNDAVLAALPSHERSRVVRRIGPTVAEASPRTEDEASTSAIAHFGRLERAFIECERTGVRSGGA